MDIFPLEMDEYDTGDEAPLRVILEKTVPLTPGSVQKFPFE